MSSAGKCVHGISKLGRPQMCVLHTDVALSLVHQAGMTYAWISPHANCFVYTKQVRINTAYSHPFTNMRRRIDRA